jgi:prophage DNA circulation protein
VPDLWGNLQEASLGGVAFPLSQRSFSGGRDLSRIKPVYQPGQAVEDTGRTPYTFKVTAELYADVDAAHYPGVFNALIGLVHDERQLGEVEYVDPLLGAFAVKIIDFDAQETSAARNGGTLSFTLEEVSIRIADFLQATHISPQSEAEQVARQADESLDAAGVSDDDLSDAFDSAGLPLQGDELSWPAGQKLTSLVGDFVAFAADAQLAVDDVQGALGNARARLASLLSLPTLRTADGWYALAAVTSLVDSISRLGDSVVARSVAVVDYTISSQQSAREIALDLYGDPSRCAEILLRNPVKNPNAIPAGTTLRLAVQ